MSIVLINNLSKVCTLTMEILAVHASSVCVFTHVCLRMCVYACVFTHVSTVFIRCPLFNLGHMSRQTNMAGYK